MHDKLNGKEGTTAITGISTGNLVRFPVRTDFRELTLKWGTATNAPITISNVQVLDTNDGATDNTTPNGIPVRVQAKRTADTTYAAFASSIISGTTTADELMIKLTLVTRNEIKATHDLKLRITFTPLT